MYLAFLVHLVGGSELTDRRLPPSKCPWISKLCKAVKVDLEKYGTPSRSSWPLHNTNRRRDIFGKKSEKLNLNPGGSSRNASEILEYLRAPLSEECSTGE